jgi:DNA polymerase III gamma/tau subunit
VFIYVQILQLHEHIVELATQKFSSNVVEQMLGVVGEDKATSILKNITFSNNIQRLTNSVYGNFVVKKVFFNGLTYTVP